MLIIEHYVTLPAGALITLLFGYSHQSAAWHKRSGLFPLHRPACRLALSHGKPSGFATVPGFRLPPISDETKTHRIFFATPAGVPARALARLAVRFRCRALRARFYGALPLYPSRFLTM